MEIELNNVRIKYPKQTKWVLDGLTMQVNTNEAVALVGNNGCGKTTTIHLICNLLEANEGEVKVFDKQLVYNKMEYKKQVGFVLSTPTYIEELSIKKYLQFVCRFQSIGKKERDGRIADTLELLRISDESDKKIATLSAGNKMKVQLAAALIHNPRLLVLDEPFVNLDVQSAEDLKNLLLQLRQSKAMLITSHHIDLVADLCDRFVVLDGGRITHNFTRQEGDTSEQIKERIKTLLTSNTTAQTIPAWMK